MGFDISYHPIDAMETKRWYFYALKQLRGGGEAAVLETARQIGMNEIYVHKYLDTLKVGLNTRKKVFSANCLVKIKPKREFLYAFHANAA